MHSLPARLHVHASSQDECVALQVIADYYRRGTETSEPQNLTSGQPRPCIHATLYDATTPEVFPSLVLRQHGVVLLEPLLSGLPLRRARLLPAGTLVHVGRRGLLQAMQRLTDPLCYVPPSLHQAQGTASWSHLQDGSP